MFNDIDVVCGAVGNEHDPITYKIYNEHTPLVAIRGTGNVYCRETIDRLNIKPGHWFDLMTDEPFTRADLITIQVRSTCIKSGLSHSADLYVSSRIH